MFESAKFKNRTFEDKRIKKQLKILGVRGQILRHLKIIARTMEDIFFTSFLKGL